MSQGSVLPHPEEHPNCHRYDFTQDYCLECFERVRDAVGLIQDKILKDKKS